MMMCVEIMQYIDNLRTDPVRFPTETPGMFAEALYKNVKNVRM